MRDQSCGTKLACLHEFEQQRRRDGVDQTRRERDVAVPQFLEVELGLFNSLDGRRSRPPFPLLRLPIRPPLFPCLLP